MTESRFAKVHRLAREMRQRINQRSTEWKTKQADEFEERPQDVTAEDSGLLNAELRRQATALYECGLTLMEVADHLKISHTTAWKAVTEKRPTNQMRRKLANAEVLEMRNEYLNGVSTVADLADKYGMCNSSVWRVITGQTYKELA